MASEKQHYLDTPEKSDEPTQNVRKASILSVGIGTRNKVGLGVAKTTFFMVAQMAGAGFLALPRAMANAGWTGLALMFLFCGVCGFSATKLGQAWVILEDRYPEYRKPARQPYAEIAYRSLGLIGRRIAFGLLLTANIGSSTVFIILISQLLNSVISSLSICEFAVIVAACLLPLTWLGSPKDFWQASVFAVGSTVLAIIIIVVKILVDFSGGQVYPLPEHPNPTGASFALGFGAILFAYGGASVFPTIQNDMKDRSKFWKSVLLAFGIILTLYFPVALFGYIYIGDSVEDNIILSINSGPVVTVAIALEIFNLLGTYIITLSPVFQGLEELFHVPPKFGIKRITLRSGLICCELLVALAFPDFGLIVNLIGGSAMSCLSFILPPIMYIKIIDDQSNPDWPKQRMDWWERCLLIEIMCVGIVGGILSTISSLYALLNPDQLQSSCFVTFGVQSSS